MNTPPLSSLSSTEQDTFDKALEGWKQIEQKARDIEEFCWELPSGRMSLKEELTDKQNKELLARKESLLESVEVLKGLPPYASWNRDMKHQWQRQGGGRIPRGVERSLEILAELQAWEELDAFIMSDLMDYTHLKGVEHGRWLQTAMDAGERAIPWLEYLEKKEAPHGLISSKHHLLQKALIAMPALEEAGSKDGGKAISEQELTNNKKAIESAKKLTQWLWDHLQRHRTASITAKSSTSSPHASSYLDAEDAWFSQSLRQSKDQPYITEEEYQEIIVNYLITLSHRDIDSFRSLIKENATEWVGFRNVNGSVMLPGEVMGICLKEGEWEAAEALLKADAKKAFETMQYASVDKASALTQVIRQSKKGECLKALDLVLQYGIGEIEQPIMLLSPLEQAALMEDAEESIQVTDFLIQKGLDKLSSYHETEKEKAAGYALKSWPIKDILRLLVKDPNLWSQPDQYQGHPLMNERSVFRSKDLSYLDAALSTEPRILWHNKLEGHQQQDQRFKEIIQYMEDQQCQWHPVSLARSIEAAIGNGYPQSAGLLMECAKKHDIEIPLKVIQRCLESQSEQGSLIKKDQQWEALKEVVHQGLDIKGFLDVTHLSGLGGQSDTQWTALEFLWVHSSDNYNEKTLQHARDLIEWGVDLSGLDHGKRSWDKGLWTLLSSEAKDQLNILRSELEAKQISEAVQSSAVNRLSLDDKKLKTADNRKKKAL